MYYHEHTWERNLHTLAVTSYMSSPLKNAPVLDFQVNGTSEHAWHSHISVQYEVLNYPSNLKGSKG